MKPGVAESFFIKSQAFKPATAQDKRRTPQRKFSCEFYEFFQDCFLPELHWMAASKGLWKKGT